MARHHHHHHHHQDERKWVAYLDSSCYVNEAIWLDTDLSDGEEAELVIVPSKGVLHRIWSEWRYHCSEPGQVEITIYAPEGFNPREVTLNVSVKKRLPETQEPDSTL